MALALTFAIAISLAWPSPIHAMAIAVTPTRIEAAIKDGDLLPPITIINNGNGEVTIRAYVGPGGHDLDGTPILSAGLDHSDSHGIELLQDKVRIPPGGHERILARVRVPDGARGGLYPVIYLECEEAGTTAGQGAARPRISPVSRIAILTLLRLPGPATNNLIARDLAVTQESPEKPVVFELTVENTGNVHSYATAFVRVTSATGEVVEDFPMQPAVVLPGCMRKIKRVCQADVFAPGTYRASAQLEPGEGESRLSWQSEDVGDRPISRWFTVPVTPQFALTESDSHD